MNRMVFNDPGEFYLALALLGLVMVAMAVADHFGVSRVTSNWVLAFALLAVGFVLEQRGSVMFGPTLIFNGVLLMVVLSMVCDNPKPTWMMSGYDRLCGLCQP